MIMYGMLDSSSAACVSVAGVGIPPGFMGMPFMQTVLPRTRSSASAAGVKSVNSGVSPASEIPGMVEVMVLATVQVNKPRLPQILESMSLATFSLPLMPSDGGKSNLVM